MRITEEIIDKLYEIKDYKLFKKIKDKNPNVRIIIATNHVSFIRNFIGESFGVDYLDDVLISAEIHKIKPNFDFFEHILNKYQLKPNELLFLDDNIENTDAAEKLGINTIYVNENSDLFKSICSFLGKAEFNN